MPISKSAKKALRQGRRRRLVNLKIKTAYKKAIKDFSKAQKSKEQAKLLSTVFSQIDKAAKKGIIHKNKAARLRSQMSLKIA